jgi:hypothetical protein
MVKKRSVHFLRSTTAVIAACAFAAQAQDLPLPQYGRGPMQVPGVSLDGGTTFLKPTKSIKPPVTAVPAPEERSREQLLREEQRLLIEKTAALAQQRAAEQKATSALKRIVVMQGPLSRKLDRSEVLPQGKEGKPVTLVGIDAPTDVVRGLEGFFGVELTPDNEKKLLDTVRKGMAGASKQDRKVEVLGWWPKEGVMAVGVYPEG